MVIHFENASEARRETKNNAYEGFVYVVGGGGVFKRIGLVGNYVWKTASVQNTPKSITCCISCSDVLSEAWGLHLKVINDQGFEMDTHTHTHVHDHIYIHL